MNDTKHCRFTCRVNFLTKKTNPERHANCEQKIMMCSLSPMCCVNETSIDWRFTAIYVCDKYADIYSHHAPMQFNWGAGPTMKSSFYRIYADSPRLDIWYEEGLSPSQMITLLKSNGLDLTRLHNVSGIRGYKLPTATFQLNQDLDTLKKIIPWTT